MEKFALVPIANIAKWTLNEKCQHFFDKKKQNQKGIVNSGGRQQRQQQQRQDKARQSKSIEENRSLNWMIEVWKNCVLVLTRHCWRGEKERTKPFVTKYFHCHWTPAATLLLSWHLTAIIFFSFPFFSHFGQVMIVVVVVVRVSTQTHTYSYTHCRHN